MVIRLFKAGRQDNLPHLMYKIRTLFILRESVVQQLQFKVGKCTNVYIDGGNPCSVCVCVCTHEGESVPL